MVLMVWCGGSGVALMVKLGTGGVVLQWRRSVDGSKCDVNDGIVVKMMGCRWWKYGRSIRAL